MSVNTSTDGTEGRWEGGQDRKEERSTRRKRNGRVGETSMYILGVDDKPESHDLAALQRIHAVGAGSRCGERGTAQNMLL